MKFSREANKAAKAIVKLVEKKTGSELELTDCVAIIAEVQRAINNSKKVAKK